MSVETVHEMGAPEEVRRSPADAHGESRSRDQTRIARAVDTGGERERLHLLVRLVDHQIQHQNTCYIMSRSCLLYILVFEILRDRRKKKTIDRHRAVLSPQRIRQTESLNHCLFYMTLLEVHVSLKFTKSNISPNDVHDRTAQFRSVGEERHGNNRLHACMNAIDGCNKRRACGIERAECDSPTRKLPRINNQFYSITKEGVQNRFSLFI